MITCNRCAGTGVVQIDRGDFTTIEPGYPHHPECIKFRCAACLGNGMIPSTRIVELTPDESWQVPPEFYEDEK